MITDKFSEWVTSDKNIARYWEKLKNGSVDYVNAEEYSELIGNKASELLEDNPEIDDIRAVLNKAYRESAHYSKNLVGNINKANNIGLKALTPKIDEDRIEHLVDKYVSEDSEWLLDKAVVCNITRSAVTDTIEYNSREQQEAGLYSYVIRDTGAGCCDWCESVAGIYEMGKQPADFWKIHKNCTCTITYKPSRRPLTKIKYVTNGKNSISKVTN